MNVLSLFDGMSCGQLALQRAGIEVEKYYASEIDQHAIKVTQHNFPGTVQLGTVKQWQLWGMENGLDWSNIDLVIAGSPCQGFSFAGEQLAFDDPRSKLFFTFVDILDHTRKHNPKVKFLLENVRMKKQFEDVITDFLGVTPIDINSDRFVAQNRPRMYWANFFIAPPPKRPDWKKKFYQYRRTYFRENKSGVCPCLTANMGTGGHNVPLHSQNLKDKLTPEECEILQTVPVGFTAGVSKTQRYKMLGNGWTVDAIAHIFNFMELF